MKTVTFDESRWQLVPVELVEILRSAVELHQKRGTVLTVHMNDLALLLDQLAAAPQQGGGE